MERFYIKEIQKYEKEMDKKKKEIWANTFLLGVSALASILLLTKGNVGKQELSGLLSTLGIGSVNSFLFTNLLHTISKKTSLELSIDDLYNQIEFEKTK